MTQATSTTDGPRMVTGLFKDRDSAERAFLIVLDRGYDKADLSVVMDDDTRQRYFPANQQSSADLAAVASEHGALGGPVGGTLGTLLAAVAAVGTFLLFPGLVVAGSLAVALAGAGVAAIAGGLIGALHDWGIPNERIKAYEAGIKRGGILIGVKARSDDDARYFEEQWGAAGAEHID